MLRLTTTVLERAERRTTKHLLEQKIDATQGMNPFRVKLSTVVATRMKMTSKSIWLEPLANRDDSISLIGQQIRCILPKNSEFQTDNIKSKSWARMFEGEVVGFVEPCDKESTFLHIKMLILRENAKQLPFPIEEYKDDENVSEKEKKYREYETIIKGKENVVIHIKIPKVSHMSKVCIRWKIHKNINHRPLIGYVGDWNDSVEQQKSNHLWCVKHELCHSSRGSGMGEDMVRVGEVTDIVPLVGKGKSKSLANVRIRPLMFLEDTIRGRIERDLNNELLDCVTTAASDYLIELPIEDLLVIGKKLVRDNQSQNVTGNSDFIVRYSYNPEKDTFVPNSKPLGANGWNDRTCSRCRTHLPVGEMIKCDGLCSLSQTELNWWCQKCVSILQNHEQVASPGKNLNCIRTCCFGLRKDLALYDTDSDYISATSQTKVCKVCSKSVFESRMFKCASCSCIMHRCCFAWDIELRNSNLKKEYKTQSICFECEKRTQYPAFDDKNQQVEASLLQQIANLVNHMGPKDFYLPRGFLEELQGSKTGPIDFESSSKKKIAHCVKEEESPVNKTSDATLPPRKKQKSASRNSSEMKEPIKILISLKDKSIIGSSIDSARTKVAEKPKKDENKGLEGICSRIEQYDPSKKIMWSSNNSAAHARSVLASSRRGGKIGSDRDENVGQTHGRASRRNQRRMLKDASFGGVKEKLTGCEHALRFGKSLIHGWGVFTDERISKGDLIVEYRGVLIGHAVANKREKEYEDAKIGSDYMFRISSSIICDATHEGNVTRFINACCSPNCYPKILVVNGVKRIAVYAKKDIMPGEELSYDYKFQPEFDETKRIPCNCGSPDCRKFMNWDYRYVAVPRQSDTSPPHKLRTKNI